MQVGGPSLVGAAGLVVGSKAAEPFFEAALEAIRPNPLRQAGLRTLTADLHRPDVN